MTNYITGISRMIAAETGAMPNAVLYGENVNTGSRISGLCKHLTAPPNGRFINVGNCEATQCGVGFGLMLNGVSSVLFMKQLDFLLLGIEHMVSTYGVIRSQVPRAPLGSFTVISIVCDQGFQGPQSSFNALGDICSLARVPGYSLTNAVDAARILSTQLRRPGLRLVCLSQRLFPSELLTPELVYAAEDGAVFQYFEGDDATIACFNFSWPEGYRLRQRLLERGITAALFSVNQVFPQTWERVGESVTQTRRLVVIDDSKSVSLLGYRMVSAMAEKCPPFESFVLTREADVDFAVSPDRLHIDEAALMAQLEASIATGAGRRGRVGPQR